jgi:glycosyltransferase involved in cell wall biosynthesis
MNTRIVIASPNLRKYSETFIHGHMDRLPNVVGVLHGGYYPTQWQGKDGTEFPLADLQPRRLFFKQAVSVSPSDLGHFLQAKVINGILAEYGPTGVEMLPVATAANIPLVVHFHGYDAFRADILEAYGAHYPTLFQKAHRVIAVSEPMAQQLIRLGAPPEKVILLPYGIPVAQFSIASPQLNPPVFLAVGRLVPKKGPRHTIEAFARVHAQMPEARLRMVGDGMEEEACRTLVQRLGLEEAVEFFGILSPAEVKEAMMGARAVVQHSLHPPDGDSEGTPLSLMEAGACGLPVVATRHGGIPGLVVEGETGFLVESGDIEGMARQMLHLATEPDLAELMGMAARIRIESAYDEVGYLERLSAIFQDR